MHTVRAMKKQGSCSCKKHARSLACRGHHSPFPASILEDSKSHDRPGLYPSDCKPQASACFMLYTAWRGSHALITVSLRFEWARRPVCREAPPPPRGKQLAASKTPVETCIRTWLPARRNYWKRMALKAGRGRNSGWFLDLSCLRRGVEEKRELGRRAQLLPQELLAPPRSRRGSCAREPCGRYSTEPPGRSTTCRTRRRRQLPSRS